jgi:hypothetical protein
MYIKEVLKIKTLTVRLDDELHKQFKIYSINKGKDMQSILIEYIKRLVEQKNK